MRAEGGEKVALVAIGDVKLLARGHHERRKPLGGVVILRDAGEEVVLNLGVRV